MHRDEILHFLSLMKSPKTEFSAEDTWLIGKLATLSLSRKNADIKNFSKQAFELFSEHSHYKNLARICLVKRTGLSNRIAVQSVEHRLAKANTMTEGYSCFVDAKGSLFQLKPSEIRLYTDAERVVEAYRAKNMPVQRSIFRIAEMKLLSGLCMPLYFKGVCAGFVFLNSTHEELASLRDSDYPILSYFESLATLNLIESGWPSFEYFQLAQHFPEDYRGAIVHTQGMKALLEKHLKVLACKTQVTVEYQGDECLCSLGNLCNIISRAAQICQAAKVEIHGSIVGRNQEWKLHITSDRELASFATECGLLQEDLKALEIGFQLTEQTLRLSLPFEPIQANNKVLYSI